MTIPTAEQFFGVTPTVYILESPGPQDIAAGRNEGDALTAVLALASIPHVRRSVTDIQSLADAMRAIPDSVKSNRQAGRRISPTVHISAHGNESGVALTSGEVVSWPNLRLLLIEVARESGCLNDRGLSLIELGMSSCFGGHAEQMFSIARPYPCVGVVGPTAAVPWSDALVAWISYYHHTLIKGTLVPDAVGHMNSAAGTTVFQLFQPADIAECISPGGAARAQAYAELLRNRGSRPASS